MNDESRAHGPASEGATDNITIAHGFAELLGILDYRPGEHISINWQEPGREFRSRIVPADQVCPGELMKLPSISDKWFGVNPTSARRGRGRADKVTRLVALFADLDDKIGDRRQITAINNRITEILGAGPSAVVHSGHGIHPYWPIADGDITGDFTTDRAAGLLALFGVLVTAAAAEVGADTPDPVFDLTRVLRIPHGFNWKDPKSRVEVRLHIPAVETAGRPLTVADATERLTAWKAQQPAKPAPSPRPSTGPGIAPAGADHPWVKKAWDSELAELAACPEGGGKHKSRQKHLLHTATNLACWECIDRDQLRAALEAASIANGYANDPDQTVDATIARGFAYADTREPNIIPAGWSVGNTDFDGDAGPADDGSAHDGRPIDGAELLDRIDTYLARFVIYPSDHYRHLHTLWIAHTHLMDCWDSTPRIAFLSPEPGSGKSRALEVTEPLVPRPVHAVNTTPAYLFRKVADPAGKPTILYDEIDTVFGPKAKDNEDIRGMLNAGHRKGAVAGRCVVKGKQIETEELDAYCAVALAGLNDLPDTIMTRSVVVRMKPRSATEKVEPWRHRINTPEAEELRSELEMWAAAVRQQASDYWPEMPPGVADRVADVAEALLSVADVAGGKWPETSRVAVVAAVADLRRKEPTIGVRLLGDIRSYFSTAGTVAATSVELSTKLKEMEEAPWGTFELDPRQLARRLAKYGLEPKNLKQPDGKVRKGYRRTDFADAWERYLPPASLPPDLAATSATSATSDGFGIDAPF